MSRELILHHLKNNKKLVIYGTGEYSKIFKVEMGISQRDIECYMETNPRSKVWNGFRVISIDDLKKINLENILIVITSSYYPEIIKDLTALGLERDKDFVHAGAYLDYIEDVNKIKILHGKTIGRYSYGVMKHIHNPYLKEIGSFCSINKDANIGPINHPLSYISTNPILYRTILEASGEEMIPGVLNPGSGVDTFLVNGSKEIIIKNDVWIGTNTLIMPGVTIGNGAIIAGGAVVTKDVPDYAIVGGVPAKVIKYRFTKEEIKKLLTIKWWEWPIEKIKANVDLLRNPEKFFESID